MQRATEPTNPWGLTLLEFAVMQAYAEHGDCTTVARTIKASKRGIEDALQRIRRKMGVRNLAQQLVKWQDFKHRRPGPRTAWVCRCCSGLGFTVGPPK